MGLRLLFAVCCLFLFAVCCWFLFAVCRWFLFAVCGWLFSCVMVIVSTFPFVYSNFILLIAFILFAAMSLLGHRKKNDKNKFVFTENLFALHLTLKQSASIPLFLKRENHRNISCYNFVCKHVNQANFLKKMYMEIRYACIFING